MTGAVVRRRPDVESALTKVLLLLSFLVLAPGAFGLTHVSEIPLLDGERWWGGGGGDGQNQPYGVADSPRIDLRTHGNTSSPLLVSSCGRYVWSEKPFGYEFKDGKLVIDSDAEKVGCVQAGKTLKDAYIAASKAHMRFGGKTPPDVFFTLPQWNNWIEMFLNGMNQSAVDGYTEELAKSGFPCGVYMMDGGWFSHQGSYEFYERDFPDPKGMFDRINANGWIPLIWTAHFVSPDSREYKRLRYCPKLGGLDLLAYRRKPGSRDAAVVRWWSGISAVYDLTKPEANEFYAKTLRDFACKYGIKGYKFDAGDPEFFAEDCRFHDENAEPVDYSRLYAELAAGEFPYHEIRVSWKCGGLPLVTRLLDRAHAWTGSDAQDTVIPQVISAGLLGCPYLVADMVGGGLAGSFVGNRIDEKLFVRSAALQALMPMMQFSPAPWRHLSQEGVKQCKRFADLHVEFAPYMLELARHASRTGEPIVRAMEYEFPHQGFNRPMQQFMLGSRWLVAPVVAPDDSKTIMIPAGIWRDDLGNEHVGPKTLRLANIPLDRLPRYERMHTSRSGDCGCAAMSASCGKVEQTATGIRLVRDGRIVWNFEIDTEDGKPYVHPLATPSGVVLTDSRPDDHPWHKGLWFAWKYVNGANGWELPDRCGNGGVCRTILNAKDVEILGLGAKVLLVLTYYDAAGAVLSERRKVDFLPPDEAGGYAIQSEHEFTALRDVTLERTPPYRRKDGAWAGGYAGFTLRLASSAAKEFSVRKDGKDFVAFVNPSTGESVFLYAYKQPATAKFYAWPDRQMLNLSPVYDGPINLKAGKNLLLSYAVQVRDCKNMRP